MTSELAADKFIFGLRARILEVGGGRADFYFYFYFWFPPLGDKTKSIVTQTKKNLGANFEHFWLVVWPQVINNKGCYFTP